MGIFLRYPAPDAPFDASPALLDDVLASLPLVKDMITGSTHNGLLALGITSDADGNNPSGLVRLDKATMIIPPHGKPHPIESQTYVRSLDIAVIPQAQQQKTFNVALTGSNWQHDLIRRLPDSTQSYAIRMHSSSISGEVATPFAAEGARTRSFHNMSTLPLVGFYVVPAASPDAAYRPSGPPTGRLVIYAMNRFFGGEVATAKGNVTVSAVPLDRVELRSTGRQSPAPRAYVYI